MSRRRMTTLIVIAAIVVVLIAATHNRRGDERQLCLQHEGAHCVQCHIPPGFTAFVKTKFPSLRELWVHVGGTPQPTCSPCHNGIPSERD